MAFKRLTAAEARRLGLDPDTDPVEAVTSARRDKAGEHRLREIERQLRDLWIAHSELQVEINKLKCGDGRENA